MVLDVVGSNPTSRPKLSKKETHGDRSQRSATKGDVLDAVEGLEVRIDSLFLAFEHRMEQLLHDMEGRLITSAYRLAESLNARLA